MTLTHLDKDGKAVMVDISYKAASERTAVASAMVSMQPTTLNAIQENNIKKGDVLAVSRVAGIMAAKKTPELIPLCHPIPLTSVSINFEILEPDRIIIRATAKTTYLTGVEMEALCAVSTAALTIYDMCKAIDKGMQIKNVQLESKSGGKSGEFQREDKNLTHD